VNAALESYAKAIDDGDIRELRAVAPVSPIEEPKLAQMLKTIRGKGYALQKCSMPEINGQTAKVSCDAVLTKVSNAKLQRIKFQLAVIKGKWMIVSSR
jgi:hypothetical protein